MKTNNELESLINQRNEIEKKISELYSLQLMNNTNLKNTTSKNIISNNNEIKQELNIKEIKQPEIKQPDIKQHEIKPNETPISFVINDAIEDSHQLNLSNSQVDKKQSPELEWREQSKNRKYNRHVVSRVISTSGEKSIQITNNISLPAISVATFNDVVDDGKLYYVESANHFAIYILKHLFHGNIGNIYNNEKMPVKIKNCQFHTKEHSNKCNYYHDPLTISGSNDVRNFVANSWTYNSNPTSEYTKQRHFGSLANLDNDIKSVLPEDIMRYKDMAFHDLLCLFILL